MPIQYYVTPIDIKKIKLSLINKLKDKFKFNEVTEEILFTKDGFYSIKNDEITHNQLIINNSSKTKINNNLLLLENNYFVKKTENIDILPVAFFNLKIKKIYFYLSNSDISMVFELKDNKVIKFYFLANKNNDKKEFFFKNDISLYLESLNI